MSEEKSTEESDMKEFMSLNKFTKNMIQKIMENGIDLDTLRAGDKDELKLNV